MKNSEVRKLSGGRKSVLGLLAFAAVSAPVLFRRLDGAECGQRGSGGQSENSAPGPNRWARSNCCPANASGSSYKNVEVRSLLRALAEAAQVNMLVSDKVTGNVTIIWTGNCA